MKLPRPSHHQIVKELLSTCRQLLAAHYETNIWQIKPREYRNSVRGTKRIR
jgi:hypothetical protein